MGSDPYPVDYATIRLWPLCMTPTVRVYAKRREQILKSEVGPGVEIVQIIASSLGDALTKAMRDQITRPTLRRTSSRCRRICSRIRSQQCVEFERIVPVKLLKTTILHGLRVDVLEELVSVLYYTKAFSTTQAMRALV